MTERYTLSKQAKLDIKDIKNYIARDSLDNAETFVRAIAQRFQSLADFPEIGRSYETLLPNLRGFLVGNYIIFYRPTKNGITIERIISGYRDLEFLSLSKGSRTLSDRRTSHGEASSSDLAPNSCP